MLGYNQSEDNNLFTLYFDVYIFITKDNHNTTPISVVTQIFIPLYTYTYIIHRYF